MEKKSQPAVSAEPDRTTDDIDGGAEREVVMPDIYGEKHELTEPPVKTLDPTSPDIDVSTGFDPYDTVVLHEKQGIKKG
jgi:hypothetical protein